MKNLILIFSIFLITSCNQNNLKERYTTINLEDCEYWSSYNHFGHKGNCPNPIHQKDTTYIYGVQIRYGTIDTIFTMYPIDSNKVTLEYTKSNQNKDE